ncbi:MAG TPA: SOS response-associated peptidase [Ornithinicoccus sp.]|nr:SOS response-associated peptidase [Ornithinicoccus sp.]
MCGRYAATADPDELIEAFEVDVDATGETSRSVLVNPQDPPVGSPDYNMAPSKQAPVVLTRAPRDDDGGSRNDGEPVRQLRLLTWGLVPSWAKDPKVGMRMVNARAESLLDKPAFAKAALARRCVVPADGWYEWQVSPVAKDAKGKPRKQPFFMHRADGDRIGFAGIYEFWRDRSAAQDDPAAWIVSFTIITTAAEEGLDRVHDRQPVVLERDAWQDWLDPATTDPDEVRALLESPGPGRFEAYPISTAVNATRNNGSHLLQRLPDDQLVGVVNPATGEVLGG